MVPSRHLIFFSVLLLSLCIPPASATTIIPVSLTELSEKVDTIVAGVVRETHAYWDEGRIYTDITVETMEFLKHPTSDRPREIVIKTLGGQVGDMRMQVHGVPKLQVDEEAVFFLMKHNEDYAIYGLHYGLCRIETNLQDTSQRVSGPIFRTRTTQNQATMAIRLNPLPPYGEELATFFQRVRNLIPSTNEHGQP